MSSSSIQMHRHRKAITLKTQNGVGMAGSIKRWKPYQTLLTPWDNNFVCGTCKNSVLTSRETWMRSLLTAWQLLSQSIYSQNFMEPECQLPRSQGLNPCPCPYPKPREVCPRLLRLYLYKAQWSLYVPPGLTFANSTFCPHSVFMCFVWIWEQTAIISLYSIKWLVFIREI